MSFEYSQTVLSQRIDLFNRRIEGLMVTNPGIKPDLLDLQLILIQLGIGYWETLSQLEKCLVVQECQDNELAELVATAAENVATERFWESGFSVN